MSVQPPKQKKKGKGKGKKGKKAAKATAIIDGISTEDMTKEQVGVVKRNCISLPVCPASIKTLLD